MAYTLDEVRKWYANLVRVCNEQKASFCATRLNEDDYFPLDNLCSGLALSFRNDPKGNGQTR